MNLLVDEGVLYKKRGIGMFVTAGARELLVAKRREQFTAQQLATMINPEGRKK